MPSFFLLPRRLPTFCRQSDEIRFRQAAFFFQTTAIALDAFILNDLSGFKSNWILTIDPSNRVQELHFLVVVLNYCDSGDEGLNPFQGFQTSNEYW